MADLALARKVGANIAVERKARDIKQGALAERLGITQGSLSKIESGAHVPGVEVLLRVSDVLGCSLTALIKGVGAEMDAYRKGYEDGWRSCAEGVSAYLTWAPKEVPHD